MIQSFLCRSPQQRERASRTAMSYDRLIQVVTEQAMQRAMVRINRRKYGTRRDRGASYGLGCGTSSGDGLIGRRGK